MSKKEFKRDILPKLQRKIVLKLAEKGALNVRETNKELKGEYTSTNRAFHELEEKCIIKKVDVKEWRGRVFPKYWLTEEGIVLAFLEGAQKDKLFENARKFYSDNENLQSFIDFTSVFNPEVFKIGYEAIKRKGKLEVSDLLVIALTQMKSEADFETYRKALTLLKKYPKISESFLKLMQFLDKIKGITFEVLES